MPDDNELFQSEKFEKTAEVRDALASRDSVFRFCSFESADLDGDGSDGVFLTCEFRNIDFYWSLFTLALFFNCKFERCTFRGASFADCRFVECVFTDCRFLKDNLGGLCDARDTKLFDCVADNCDGWGELFPDR
ncbi:MAG: pentapeptide repeat-containing protein [Sideroxydans sp.]|nr:pentapeptide repeat-containing protein [Sideroxydans sp.]